MLADERVEVVVNFAAEAHDSLAVVDPGRFFRTNVIGTQTLLEAARRTGVTRFHHVSTCEVYGDLALDTDESFTEDSPYRPRTPYNASKAGADHAVRAYHETYGLPVTITNCANNYGPRQFPEKVIPLFVTNAFDEPRAPLCGCSSRTWVPRNSARREDLRPQIERSTCVLQAAKLTTSTSAAGARATSAGSAMSPSWNSTLGRQACALKRYVPDRRGRRLVATASSRLTKCEPMNPAPPRRVRARGKGSGSVDWYREHRER